MIKVKVCGMTEPYNIKLVSETRPDYLGFIFYTGSRRYMGETLFPEDLEELPPTIARTGVFVNEKSDKVISLAQKYKLNILQLHGKESPAYCKKLKEKGFTVVKSFGIENSDSFNDIEAYDGCCDFFLFDTKTENHGGSGIKFQWNILNAYSLPIPFFLSGGIGPEDLAAIKNLNDNRLYAIDINSRFEIRPGLKNVELIDEFIKGLKSNLK